MANDEISLETRASAAYVQGRLQELSEAVSQCCCPCSGYLQDVLEEWKQAEAELKVEQEAALQKAYVNHKVWPWEVE